ncbi:MAG: 7-dehydrocholesterol reductase [Chlamydiae bacterium RIFCSPHIGHO2_12_FULL_49_9]|nr:MAG: 7-dehydrocholesterol reductase [Chlamydiae bacterium RIFCSPHIGHO2_12_FULL_49_9]
MHKTLIPLFFLLLCPPTVFVFWYTCTYLNGSLLTFWEIASRNGGLVSATLSIWKPLFFGSKTSWYILTSFALFQLFLMKAVPGKLFYGPITPQGNTPVYKANGIACFLITLATFFLSASVFHLFPATILYDNLGPLLGALNCFSLVFCLFLYLKGIFFPSSSDSGASGNPLFDYYWGTELYPRVLCWDIKMFTNCRFGMMSWPLLILSYGAKQAELYGLSDSMMVAIALQLLYVGKFFLWETGYLRSLDIMHDRAGFYICWGCLVWVPCIYTSPALYLVNHPNDLGIFWSSLIFLAGAFSIGVNFLADKQRQLARATNGKHLVWKKTPTLIEASFQTENGETQKTLLLASGWWGLARHFHYIPELLGAFFWSLPALFLNFLPYFYVLFLAILLVDRAFRHDRRCKEKYGKSWDEYCEKVPYKMIPFIF